METSTFGKIDYRACDLGLDLIPRGLGLGLLLEGPWTSAAQPTVYHVIGGFRRDQERDLLFCWRNK